MKVKKILGYIGVGLVGVVTGAMIFSPEARESVIGGIKTGKDWVVGRFGKKEENTCEDEVSPENEEPAPESKENDRQKNGGKWGGYYKKPYNNKKNN